jgi:hypothetical protein
LEFQHAFSLFLFVSPPPPPIPILPIF